MQNNKKNGLGNFQVNREFGEPMQPSRNFSSGGDTGAPPAGSSGSSGLLPTELIKKIANGFMDRLGGFFNIVFPSNYYNPVGTDAFDIRALDVYTSGEDRVLLSYKAEAGQTIRFIKYGVFTNIVLADNVRMYPTIDGNRILRYHGDPNQDFAINLSLGPDLTENSLIPCDFELKAGQLLELRAVNTSGVQAEIGARFRGYLVNENASSRGFGG